MKRTPPPVFALVLADCQTADPYAGGASAGAGVDAGRVRAGMGTGGACGSVDAMKARNVDIGIGTGGPSASARMGDSPVKVRLGPHGLRFGT